MGYCSLCFIQIDYSTISLFIYIIELLKTNDPVMSIVTEYLGNLQKLAIRKIKQASTPTTAQAKDLNVFHISVIAATKAPFGFFLKEVFFCSECNVSECITMVV